MSAGLVVSERAIYLTASPDGGVLFDVARDQLLKLNPVGVQMAQQREVSSSRMGIRSPRQR